jgi:hypothetical protein
MASSKTAKMSAVKKGASPRERAHRQVERRDRIRARVPDALVSAATVGTAAAALGPHTALATVVLATVPSLVALAAPLFLGDAKPKLDRWTTRLYGDDPSRTPEEVRALYEEKVRSSPGAREAVLRSVNKLLESDECTVDAIAALTAEYVKADLRPDEFYRSLLSLLSSVSSLELAALRTFVEATIAKCGSASHAHLWTCVEHDDIVQVAPGSAEYAKDDEHGSVDSKEVRAPLIRRVVQLLRNVLLVDGGTGSQLSIPVAEGPPTAYERWPSIAVAEVQVLRRLRRFIR